MKLGICPECGEKFTMDEKQIRLGKKFCSKRCQVRFFRKQQPPLLPCEYNDCVRCEKKACHTCGWNPEVARLRLEKIRKELMDEECIPEGES